MLSKNKIKHIQSLKVKKYRAIHEEFIAEGEKISEELLQSDFTIKSVYATSQWLSANKQLLKKTVETIEITFDELKKISGLNTPNEVLLVCSIPQYKLQTEALSKHLSIVLDNVQDPGNLGTIIRLADWFGIENIICSEDCADMYIPKVVQATMGSITRVKLHYTKLSSFFKDISKENIPIYGALLNGKNIYKQSLSSTGIIVMGNESKGISKEVMAYIKYPLLIPSFSLKKEIDSLNVAMATAIICSEFKTAR